jgi:hypothetical protein
MMTINLTYKKIQSPQTITPPSIFAGEQLTMFGVMEPEYLPEATAEERFNNFHSANPHVLWAIISLIDQAKAKNIKKWSIRSIFHILRWDSAMRTNGNEPWKLNDHFSPFYVRMIIDHYPEHDGFFEERKSRADNARWGDSGTD